MFLNGYNEDIDVMVSSRLLDALVASKCFDYVWAKPMPTSEVRFLRHHHGCMDGDLYLAKGKDIFIVQVLDAYTGEELEYNLKAELVKADHYRFGDRMSDDSPFNGTFWDAATNISPVRSFAFYEDAARCAESMIRDIDPYDVIIYSYCAVNLRDGQVAGEIYYAVDYDIKKITKDPQRQYVYDVSMCPNFVEELHRIPYDYRLTSRFKKYKYLVESDGDMTKSFHFVWSSHYAVEYNVASYDDPERMKNEMLDMVGRGSSIKFIVDTNVDRDNVWHEIRPLFIEVDLSYRSESGTGSGALDKA